ncbi:MAG: sulfate reduction electron transfer complex DsrMKJOP subunit DsrJ [bacterium]|nr:sulfate reduction electron transfer complex DsrMKJOP subunit DsrJ [bacterium]
MKLYGGSYIIAGLVVFLGIATFPIWYGAIGQNKPAFQSPPNPAGEQCIEPREYMRDRHMQLLTQWRDEAVRGGDWFYTATSGRKWTKSLTLTCMECHGKADAQGRSLTAATYCGECHDYVGVSLYCWDCHVDPAAPSAAGSAGRKVALAAHSNARRPGRHD